MGEPKLETVDATGENFGDVVALVNLMKIAVREYVEQFDDPRHAASVCGTARHALDGQPHPCRPDVARANGAAWLDAQGAIQAEESRMTHPGLENPSQQSPQTPESAEFCGVEHAQDALFMACSADGDGASVGTGQLLDVIQHSLGCDQFGRGSMYRNHFVTGEGSTDHPICMRAVSLGLMDCRRKGYELYGGDDVFAVTPEGKAWMVANSPAPPKLTRSQRRYLAYLNADCPMSFREWISYWKPESHLNHTKGTAS